MACVLESGIWTTAPGLTPRPCSDGQALQGGGGGEYRKAYFFCHKKVSNDSLTVQPVLKAPCTSTAFTLVAPTSQPYVHPNREVLIQLAEVFGGTSVKG